MSLVIVLAAMAIFIVIVVFISRSRGAPFGDALRGLAAAEGWTEIKLSFLGGAVYGKWQGRAAAIDYAPSHRQSDSRTETGAIVVVTVEMRGPRLAITLRDPDDDLWTKPITLTGPPLVDLPHLEVTRRLWVRCDDAALAERLLRDSNIAAHVVRLIGEGVPKIASDGHDLRIDRPISRTEDGGIPAVVEIARQTWHAAAAIAQAAPR